MHLEAHEVNRPCLEAVAPLFYSKVAPNMCIRPERYRVEVREKAEKSTWVSAVGSFTNPV